MRKRLFLSAAALCAALTMGLSACGAAAPEAKVVDYMKQITLENNVSDINAIIGADGVKESKDSYDKYVWTIGEDATISALVDPDGSVTGEAGTVYNLKADFDDKLIANGGVKFDRYDEIDAALDTDESLTYEQFVEIIGGVEGTLVERSTSSVKYLWADNDGGYIGATFSLDYGICTFVSGWF